MNLELYLERLEQYETGALPEAERLAFEQELLTNTELREALALYREANAAIEQGIENNLRAQLQTWAAEEAGAGSPGARVVPIGRSWIRWAAAACAALLIGWLGLTWVGQGYSDQALYAANYEKPADSSFRAATAGENPLQPGINAWQEGRLLEAIAFFRSINPDSDRYAEAQYYLGHVALQAQQYDIAVSAFKQSAQQEEPRFQEKAEWNLLLAYVAAGRTEDPFFQEALLRMANDSRHSYSEKAGLLKAHLSSVWRNWR